MISFAFTIDGVSRACTHQLVRTRIGAAVLQHGGRDNDWRHRNWTLPETIRRACIRYPMANDPSPEEEPYDCCVDDSEPINLYFHDFLLGTVARSVGKCQTPLLLKVL